MAKHRKTRQEKVLADHRHITYHLEPSSAQVSFPTEKKAAYELDLPTLKTKTLSHTFVINDIRKTAIITGLIVTVQIVIFFILNRI
ncbi:MAG: hypothetical protein ACD_37C00499G0002 [uncultured bacterium]|nr:MAG: hypothetical protein ACD_37C00499G0002 [uncultured bacterium]